MCARQLFLTFQGSLLLSDVGEDAFPSPVLLPLWLLVVPRIMGRALFACCLLVAAPYLGPVFSIYMVPGMENIVSAVVAWLSGCL